MAQAGDWNPRDYCGSHKMVLLGIGFFDARDVVPQRFPTMSSLRIDKGKPNRFLRFLRSRRFSAVPAGAESATIARVICVNIEGASKLAQDKTLKRKGG
jgi:hypothetical protein